MRHDPAKSPVGHDPVQLYNGQWHFWDETWSCAYGPFDSEAQARFNLDWYCLWLDTGWVFEHVDG
jgi:hypothetical protein